MEFPDGGQSTIHTKTKVNANSRPFIGKQGVCHSQSIYCLHFQRAAAEMFPLSAAGGNIGCNRGLVVRLMREESDEQEEDIRAGLDRQGNE